MIRCNSQTEGHKKSVHVLCKPLESLLSVHQNLMDVIKYLDISLEEVSAMHSVLPFFCDFMFMYTNPKH